MGLLNFRGGGQRWKSARSIASATEALDISMLFRSNPAEKLPAT